MSIFSIVFYIAQFLINAAVVYFGSVIFFFSYLNNFEEETAYDSQSVQLAIFFLLILEIISNCNTGYYEKGLLIMDRKQIQLNYYRNGLIYDLLALLSTILNHGLV